MNLQYLSNSLGLHQRPQQYQHSMFSKKTSKNVFSTAWTLFESQTGLNHGSKHHPISWQSHQTFLPFPPGHLRGAHHVEALEALLSQHVVQIGVLRAGAPGHEVRHRQVEGLEVLGADDPLPEMGSWLLWRSRRSKVKKPENHFFFLFLNGSVYITSTFLRKIKPTERMSTLPRSHKIDQENEPIQQNTQRISFKLSKSQHKEIFLEHSTNWPTPHKHHKRNMSFFSSSSYKSEAETTLLATTPPKLPESCLEVTGQMVKPGVDQTTRGRQWMRLSDRSVCLTDVAHTLTILFSFFPDARCMRIVS